MENVIHNLKEHIYRPVEIPRHANLLFLVTAESVDEILKIGCIPKNTYQKMHLLKRCRERAEII